MSVPSIAFFNNKGGVGKTSLVYHLAWMFADLGVRALAADLDPQANLTAALLHDDDVERLWTADAGVNTIYRSVEPLVRGLGDVTRPASIAVGDMLSLVPGDLALSRFEGPLAEAWPKCADRDERALRVTSALFRAVSMAAQQDQADIVLVDLGPNLGALNRSALLAAEYMVVPVAPDLYSLLGLRNLGPTIREWRDQWTIRREQANGLGIELPVGRIRPLGYVVLQHAVRLDRPTRAYGRWLDRIPSEYSSSVLGENREDVPAVTADPHCLAMLKHYRSLMPMALESRKPVFHLKPADGAIGAHAAAVTAAYKDFERLARVIACGVGVPIRNGLPK